MLQVNGSRNVFSSKLQCGKEDCFLNQLSNHDKKQIDEKIFAPDHPTTWDKNPTEWLSNIPNILLPINTDRLILHPLKA